MNPLLDKAFKNLEDERKSLFLYLSKFTDEQLNKKPTAEAWSATEILSHLIIAEEMSLKYLQKKIQDTTREKPENIKRKLRWLLVRFVFTFNIKFTAPEIVAPNTDFVKLSELDVKWQQVRTETRNILNPLSEAELNKTLWKHAIAGKLNLHHMMQFFGIHFNRHCKQIERTMPIVIS